MCIDCSRLWKQQQKMLCHQTDAWTVIIIIWAALSYSARRYNSAVCCSKMSRDAFLSETLYEADKVLEKFAAAPQESVRLQDGRRSRR